jgi:hypothetical protein
LGHGDCFFRASYFSILRNVGLACTFLGLPADGYGLPEENFGGDVMKRMLSMAILALAISAPAALAQTTNPGVSTAPSPPNSGAGIAGQPGAKSGPAARPGDTVGSAAGANQQNSTDQLQDTSNIKGLPGNKSGPPAKQSDRK